MKVSKVVLSFVAIAIIGLCFTACNMEAKINDYAIELLQKHAPDDEFTFVEYESADATYTYYSKIIDGNFGIRIYPMEGMFGHKSIYITNYFAYRYKNHVTDDIIHYFTDKGLIENKDFICKYDPDQEYVELCKHDFLINSYEAYIEAINNPEIYTNTYRYIDLRFESLNTKEDKTLNEKFFNDFDAWMRDKKFEACVFMYGYFYTNLLENKLVNSDGHFSISKTEGCYESYFYEGKN